MSELRLYNTLTRKKEIFHPIDPDNVRMYVCGPTVYDFAHIGNARPAIVFDVLFRLLRHLYGADHVTYVRNITDVDDKINARALRDYPDLPLNEAIRKVTEATAKQYHEDVAALGCLKPTVEPRATEHIAGMVKMIQQLLDGDCAYVAEGGEGAEVLFDVHAMPDYGALSRRKLEDQQAGARIAVEAHKKNAADFVLWKQSGTDAPGWDATFTADGKTVSIHGRPGWHLECSVMSEAHLGDVFDIHGGGLDLIFPHHENEIAQSRCAHGTKAMANYWMHNGFLQVEGRKMAKSEGNFITINDLLHTEKFGGRKWPGEVLRLAMLMTHYREPIDFSVKRLEEAESILNKWADASFGISDVPQAAASTAHLPKGNPLLDDLNTPKFIQNLHGIANDAKTGGEQAKIVLRVAFDLLGIGSLDRFARQVVNAIATLEPAEEEAINRRLSLLREKNFTEADKIRDELAEQGIQLMDYKDPETGERKTRWEVRR